MTVHSFQVIFKATSGLPTDRYVNTWHFDHAGPATDYDDARNLLKDFYTVAPTGNPVCWHFPNNIATTAEVKAYVAGAPKPNYPVYESTFTLAPGISAAGPQEIALCFSFEAAKVGGEVQARKRNRIYLGPLHISAQNQDRPTSTMRTLIKDAGVRLKTASDASATWDWVVYSPMEDEKWAVSRIWLDDAWDVQRRRGLTPTTRTQHVF